MKGPKFELFKRFRIAVSVITLCAGPVAAWAQGDACAAQAGWSFICGPQNAEDLVGVPRTRWLLSSSMTPGGALYLIDAERKTWSKAFADGAFRGQQDMETYGACPGAPEPGQFMSHGLSLQAGAAGHSTLYVVGHGGREAIEVFDVDATGGKPELTWKGCVPTPDGTAANSVASLGDGSLLATIPLTEGIPISRTLAGEPTGGVYAWSPGDPGFTPVRGTEMPYANGIEVSPDGTEFYVASSGLFTVTAFTNTNPARVLRRSEPLPFLPDNIHLDQSGQLITAGLNLDDPECGTIQRSETFDFPAFMACPRPFTIWSIEPKTMQGRAVAEGPANKNFSNITMGLPVGDELWVGTFAGDRVAYRSMTATDQEP